MNRIFGVVFLIFLILLVSGGIFFITKQKNNSKKTAPTLSQGQKEEIQKVEKIKAELKDTMVPLPAINKSGESGVAILKEVNGKVEVQVSMTSGFAQNTPQPAHIHVGECPGIGEVKYPLNNLVNGRSTTSLPVSLAELKKLFPLAINVHKSESDAKTYIACGDMGKDPFNNPPSVQK